jgi:hypothetical protein
MMPLGENRRFASLSTNLSFGLALSAAVEPSIPARRNDFEAIEAERADSHFSMVRRRADICLQSRDRWRKGALHRLGPSRHKSASSVNSVRHVHEYIARLTIEICAEAVNDGYSNHIRTVIG